MMFDQAFLLEVFQVQLMAEVCGTSASIPGAISVQEASHNCTGQAHPAHPFIFIPLGKVKDLTIPLPVSSAMDQASSPASSAHLERPRPRF